jgi:hypothetical protein
MLKGGSKVRDDIDYRGLVERHPKSDGVIGILISSREILTEKLVRWSCIFCVQKKKREKEGGSKTQEGVNKMEDVMILEPRLQHNYCMHIHLYEERMCDVYIIQQF